MNMKSRKNVADSSKAKKQGKFIVKLSIHLKLIQNKLIICKQQTKIFKPTYNKN